MYYRINKTVTYTDDAIVDVNATTVFIGQAGVTALTLPDPQGLPNGHSITFVAITAQAHTVTHTGGFGDAGTGADVATFGGAIGDSFVAIVNNDTWQATLKDGVTLG